MHPAHESLLRETRRQFLGRTGTGLGLAALGHLLGSNRADAAGAPAASIASPRPRESTKTQETHW